MRRASSVSSWRIFCFRMSMAEGRGELENNVCLAVTRNFLQKELVKRKGNFDITQENKCHFGSQNRVFLTW